MSTNTLGRRSFLGAIASLSAACAVPLDEDDERSEGSPLSRSASGVLLVDLKADCGAKGDGKTNDTSAFQKAAKLIYDAGGGELTIPAGVYIVGRQYKKKPTDGDAKSRSTAFYRREDIFAIAATPAHPVTNVKINGFGATIRIASDLHYGGFDPVSGLPMDAGPGEVIDANAAHVGRVFELSDCDHVWIRGVEIDGNLFGLILGGQWGDTGRQCEATGIWLNRCLNAAVTDVHTHHHALDGIAVLHTGSEPTITKQHRLARVVSEYNGRQGLSWIGGKGLEVYDSKFNHTGKAKNRNGELLMSKPGAGLDIEPNAGRDEKSSDGLFTRCEFVNNAGAGLLAAVGHGGYSTFDDCTFWGTTSYSLWLGQPGLKFVASRVYGTALHVGDGHSDDDEAPNAALATVFDDCDFEDKEWTDGNVKRNNALYSVPVRYRTNADGSRTSLGSRSNGATWKNCRFVANEIRGVSISDASTRERFEGCTFTHRYAHSASADTENGWQSRFEGSQLTSCRFMESSALTRTYRIDVDHAVVATPPAGASPTRVDGPRVRWRNGSGPTGTIAPGTYTT
jgi:hypothetical protein